MDEYNIEHPHTDQCGFDRNASISEDTYVCMCGWRAPKEFEQPAQVVDHATGQVAFSKEKEQPTGFAAMGHPVPAERKERAYDAAQSMGLTRENAFAVVGWMSEQLRRDKPHEALHGARKWVDLTGAYRLMATLLT